MTATGKQQVKGRSATRIEYGIVGATKRGRPRSGKVTIHNGFSALLNFPL